MRRWVAIAKATALETLSEPLSLLLLLFSLALAIFAPAFHYHQFGEATRMARDAGFSALFLGGGVFSIFVAIRSFRREIETGTLEMALAHPVTRAGFYLAKTMGVMLAYLAFFAIVFSTMTVIYEGAAIGGVIARRSGDIARVFGPCLAYGVAIILLPLIIAAALNRFVRCRFVFTSFVLAFILALVGFVAVAALSRGMVLKLVPAALPLAMLSLFFVAASTAFAMRFRANGAASLSGIVAALMLPAVGNYYLPDALNKGGAVSWGYVALAAAAILPAIAAMLTLGIMFAKERD